MELLPASHPIIRQVSAGSGLPVQIRDDFFEEKNTFPSVAHDDRLRTSFDGYRIEQGAQSGYDLCNSFRSLGLV